jgi:hypothetical protein
MTSVFAELSPAPARPGAEPPGRGDFFAHGAGFTPG